MAAPVNTLFDTHKIRIEEKISKTIEVFLMQADPLWRDTLLSSQGVGSTDALGRGLELVKIFQNATAGVIENGSVRNDWTTFGDDTVTSYGPKFFLNGVARTLPDPLEDPSASPYKLRVPIRSVMTTMKMTLGEKQAEATPAFIGQITAPRLVAFARNLARYLCSSWYTSQALNFRLCGLGPSSGTDAYAIDGTAKTITFTPDNKAISRLAVGDRIDIFADFSSVPVRMNDTNVTAGGVVSGDAAGQTLATRIKAFISKVDKMRGTAVIVFDPATASGKFTTTGSLTASQLGNSAYIVWANTRIGNASFTGIPGIHSWMKFGGSTNQDNYLLGNEAIGTVNDGIIDVGVHPEFKSFLKGVNGVLTEHKLNLYLDRFMEAAEDEGHYLDTLVTTNGVIRASAALKEARQYLDRTGRLSSLAMEGNDGAGMVHHHDGKEYKVHTSRWMEYGTLIGYRRQNNWTRYVPATTPGSQGMGGLEAGIPFEFLVPSLTGLPTTRWPVYLNGQLTDASQMPGHLRMTLVPEKQVRALKLTGLTEERIYSDAAS